jgi:hypothetical protein
MTTIESLDIASSRFSNWSRVLFVTLAAIGLVALSFTVGRATMGHTSSAKPVTQTNGQPAPVTNDAPDIAKNICRPSVRC